MINLTTFFTSLGIVNGNTQATNFYDFWYGIEFNGGTITYNITEFMTYLGTNRYEFFHSLESTYPGVFDEYTFYSNIDDPRITDFSTFYTYAGQYLTGVPITPTPTPTLTPTNTPTPTITPTKTPTPTPTPSSIYYYYNILLCGGGEGEYNKIRSVVPVTIGTVVSLAALPACYTVVSVSDASGIWVSNFNTYIDCNDCLT
jgi:hypothetical protein